MIHNPDLPKPIEVLPHRPPRLWLSGVTELDPGQSGKGFWLPKPEDFDGHFEGFPVLMGIMQAESTAQLGGYVMMAQNEEPLMGLLTGLDKTRYKRIVSPGEELELTFELLIQDESGRFTGEGVSSIEGEVTCKTTILGVLMPRETAMGKAGGGEKS